MTELIKTAALSVDFDRETRTMRASGALSLMVQPAIKLINQRLNEEKPAMVRLKDIVISTWLPPIPSGPFKRLLIDEAKNAIGRAVPETLSIEVTRKCGANCDHCLIKEGDGELSYEEIQRIVKEALDMGTCIITFTEGDPLLREDIFDLIKSVDKEKAIVNLFTPGLDMTVEKAVKLREAGLYNIIIGVYSANPEEHDRIRGVEGSHAKAIEAIKVALETGLMVTMSFHIKGGEVDRILDLYELSEKLGVHELSIWEGIPKTEEERLTQIEREKIVDIYRKINSQSTGPRIFASTFFEGQMLGCMAARRWLHVGVNGSIRACPYLQKEYANIRDVSLEKAWKDMRKSGEFEGLITTCPAQESQ